MLIKYELEVSCRCPVDGLPDKYQVTIETSETICVEEIIEKASELKDLTMFQEELTQNLHRSFNCSVSTFGYHSGVKTSVYT
jgi:NADPH-dependent 7-cyano-7-deazaguanine reductase QueF